MTLASVKTCSLSKEEGGKLEANLAHFLGVCRHVHGIKTTLRLSW